MHVGSPLRSVIPSLEGAVLAVLAGTTSPLSGRRVAGLASASHPAATAALRRLAQSGIVLATHQGPSILYVANREHLAWPAIEALARLRPATLDLLRTTIGTWPLAAQSAVVFGSFARADGDQHSDIDVLLVRPDGVDAEEMMQMQWQEQLSGLSDTVQRATGNSVQLLDEDLGKLRRRLDASDPLVTSWLDDSIHLAGRPLRQVLHSAADLETA